jgi:hypothetical protein
VGIALAAQVLVQILLPAYLIWDVDRTKEFTPASRHLHALTTALALAVIFFIARWDITSYGSVTAQKGATVSGGDEVGRAGNSGNTTQPHLHIHAVRPGEDMLKGRGVPITLDGDFPTRNSLFP